MYERGLIEIVMVEVIEHTPTRLVVRDQRRTAGILAAVFTALSGLSVVILTGQAIESLIWAEQRDFLVVRWFGFALFISFFVAFIAIGVMAYQHFMKGMTLILDKDDETMKLRMADVFRMKDITKPIYGISHVTVRNDERMRVYAIFIVLRTGDEFPIATLASVDEDQMKKVVAEMRSFLHA